MRRTHYSLMVAGVAGIINVLYGALPAIGQGFTIYSQSACTAARGGAGVASPCADGSAIFYNAAGLLDTPDVVTVGANLVAFQATFTADDGPVTDQEAPAAVVPHLYGSYRPHEAVAVGMGIFVPYGLTIEWPGDFRGAFSGSRGKLASFYFQPTLAIRAAGWLQLGGGVDAVRTSVQLRQRLDLSTVTAAVTAGGPITFGQVGVPRPTGFADATLKGSTWSSGWHVGAILRPTERLSVGARYLSEVRNSFDEGEASFSQLATGILLPAGNPLGAPPGTPLDAILAAQFQPGGQLVDQGVATDLTFPSQLVLGVSAAVGGRVRLHVDHVWTDWSAYREIQLEFAEMEEMVLIQDYEDTGTLRVGADLQATDALVVRAGFTRNDPAAPDATVTPLLPDSRRTSFNFGAGGRLWGRWKGDAFLSYIDQAHRRGRLLPRPDRSVSAEELNEGEFSGRAFEGGVTVSYTW